MTDLQVRWGKVGRGDFMKWGIVTSLTDYVKTTTAAIKIELKWTC